MIISILLAVIIGNILSVAAASIIFKINDSVLQKMLKHIYAFSGGTLLGAAFLGMLPNAINQIGFHASYYVLIGVLFFFLTEKFMLWRICVDENCVRHKKSGALMLMIGDSFHNFLDGVVITAAFFNSPTFGIVVAITVFAHELPQEIADFGVMLKAGYSKHKAFAFNLFSGATAILGALLAWYAKDITEKATPFVLSLSAASFIYIALADLIPELHRATKIGETIKQFLLLGLGILVIVISIFTVVR